MRLLSRLVTVILLGSSLPALATVFAAVHGVVHDPQHRPIANAAVTLQAANSSFTLRVATDSEGAFEVTQTPIGVYLLQVMAPGFASVSQPITVASGTNPVLHIPLSIHTDTQSVVVQGLAGSGLATFTSTIHG